MFEVKWFLFKSEKEMNADKYYRSTSIMPCRLQI